MKKRSLGILTRTLGDCVMISVLAKNIKLAYPDLDLDWVIEEKYLEIIKYNTNIEKKIVLQNTINEWHTIVKLCKDYDKIFMCQQIRPEDGSWHQQDKYRFKNLIDFYAERGNIKLLDRKLEWYFDPLCEIKKDNNKKKIFVHTTTLGDAKNWSKFSELVNQLKQFSDFEVYQVGLPSDLNSGVTPDFDLRGKLTITDIAKILSQPNTVFVGLDSGLSFVSAAVNCPSICIMGASNDITSGPWGDNVTKILSTTRDECLNKRCHALYGKCKYDKKCIDNISVEDILSLISNKFSI